MVKNRVIGLCLLSMFFICVRPAGIYDLKCEVLTNPIGIDNANPHFSWKIGEAENNYIQDSYQIIVSSSKELSDAGKGDLWNTGRVKSGESIWIIYKGKELRSRDVAYWKVRVWNKKGEASRWSPISYFSVGLLKAEDWKGKYIGMPTANEEQNSPMFKQSFNWSVGKTRKVFLYINSLGYNEVYINGSKVGEGLLTPGVVEFDKRSLSLTYEVSEYLKNGRNDVVIWAGKGWYRNSYPGVVNGGPYVRAQMEYKENGVLKTLLATDKTWQSRESAYFSPGTWHSHHFEGEIVDGNKMLPDLTRKSLESVVWSSVKEVQIPIKKCSPQMSEVNKIQKTIHPISIKALNDTTWMVDMGVCITGWAKMVFHQLLPLQKISMNYSDCLDKTGDINKHNREDKDYYIASGKKEESFINKFNYHGFRYIKIMNMRSKPELSDITGYLIRTGYGGASTFECSDKDMNKIHDMIHYTIECLTLGGYMVDCPHIERMGYGGDGHASTLTALSMYNMSPLYNNWLQAWGDCIRSDGGLPHTAPCPYSAGGGPYWCAFIVSSPWQLYVNYGDKGVLRKYYPYMEQWLRYVQRYKKEGLLAPWPNTEYRNWYLGDWASPKGVNMRDSISVSLVDNCVISECYKTVSKIALILGKDKDATMYRKQNEEINKLIQAKYYNSEKKCYASGSQIDQIYPMLIGVTPQSLVPEIEKTLYSMTEEKYRGHLATGLVGIPVLSEWSVKRRKGDFVYGMLKKRDYPGYLYMMDNGGTTTWEQWDGQRSRIHNCYNGIGSWFYESLAGIVADEKHPGYKEVRICPQLAGDITWVKASEETPYGKIAVDWQIKSKKFYIKTVIPVGCKATIMLPGKGCAPIHVNSGKYTMECDL